jgi:GNAT superfamily N-acetyltransferase
MGVRFTDCPADFVPDVQAFFAAMYSPQYVMARDATFLRWQFSGLNGHTPDDPLHLKIALVDDKLAGCVGYIPVDVQIAGRTMRGAWAANWMVDDSYRRLGLGPLLMRELSKQFDVTAALGGNSDAHQLLPRMGWTDFGNLPRYVRVLDDTAAGRLTSTGVLSWPVQVDAADAIDGLSIRQVEQFDDLAAGLWDRIHGQTGAGTRRSAEFLNWRYQRHPNFAYVLLEATRGNSLEGLAVYRIEHVKDLPVVIVRMVELFASPGAAEPLIDAIVERARQAGAAAVDFFCSSRCVEDPLLKRGFLRGTDSPASEIPMLFQPVDRSRAGVLFLAHLRADPIGPSADWYVTTADGDQDRPS